MSKSRSFLLLLKISVDDILKYFSQKIDFDISCELSPKPKETICLNVEVYFLENNKRNIVNLSSAELMQRVIKFKLIYKKFREA